MIVLHEIKVKPVSANRRLFQLSEKNPRASRTGAGSEPSNPAGPFFNLHGNPADFSPAHSKITAGCHLCSSGWRWRVIPNAPPPSPQRQAAALLTDETARSDTAVPVGTSAVSQQSPSCTLPLTAGAAAKALGKVQQS